MSIILLLSRLFAFKAPCSYLLSEYSLETGYYRFYGIHPIISHTPFPIHQVLIYRSAGYFLLFDWEVLCLIERALLLSLVSLFSNFSKTSALETLFRLTYEVLISPIGINCDINFLLSFSPFPLNKGQQSLHHKFNSRAINNDVVPVHLYYIVAY